MLFNDRTKHSIKKKKKKEEYFTALKFNKAAHDNKQINLKYVCFAPG